jgi:hypothetical protein
MNGSVSASPGIFTSYRRVTCEDLGDPAARAALVARLAAVIGATAVRADSAGSPLSWVRADGAIGGLRVHAFTPVPVQHAGDLPLACTGTGQVAEAATPSLPPGWRWLTSLDPPPLPQGPGGLRLRPPAIPQTRHPCADGPVAARAGDICHCDTPACVPVTGPDDGVELDADLIGPRAMVGRGASLNGWSAKCPGCRHARRG